ncbi:MAG: YbhN family protein [Gemmatimonadales bacterium]
MTPLEAHLICVGLVLADLFARAWRIQWLARGLGYRLRFRDAFTVNAFGDAACAVTPMRLGGEPARLGGLLRAGIPPAAAFVAITYEVLAAWPVILLTAFVVGWRYAPDWWHDTAPRVGAALREAWIWLVVVVALTLLAWVWVKLRAPAATRHLKRPVRRALVHWRQMQSWSVAAGLPMTLVNVVTRVAILPVLVSSLPDPPALGPVLVGSFALLYSQLILPTPSGAGMVDLGFLAGAAGELGTAEGGLLLAWRFYTTGIGVLLGFGLAIHTFGWQTVRRFWKRPEVMLEGK